MIISEDVEELAKEIKEEKRSSRVFCIGNGESRIGIDLLKYKKFGRIYGCNAIYRDHPNLCDVLTGVDHGMIHEIYHAGMAQKIPCYFRNWTKVPAHTYDAIIQDGLSKEELDRAIEQGAVITNGRGDSKEYVLHGSNLKGVVSELVDAQVQLDAAKDLISSIKETEKEKGYDPKFLQELATFEYDYLYNEQKKIQTAEEKVERISELGILMGRED